MPLLTVTHFSPHYSLARFLTLNLWLMKQETEVGSKGRSGARQWVNTGAGRACSMRINLGRRRVTSSALHRLTIALETAACKWRLIMYSLNGTRVQKFHWLLDFTCSLFSSQSQLYSLVLYNTVSICLCVSVVVSETGHQCLSELLSQQVSKSVNESLSESVNESVLSELVSHRDSQWVNISVCHRVSQWVIVSVS